MAAGPINERNQDATIYVGGLDERVTESLLWEFFLQAGHVQSVHMPRDRITQLPQGYGFIEFSSERDADYAIKIMNMIKVFNKPIRVNKPSAHHKNLDIGANLFIGNLDPEIDEKYLYDTFSAFGVILQTPKIMRDPDTGMSKGIAFINFASFEASDSAMEALNGQFLSNRAIRVSYSFKKDGKGERHGTASERLLASKKPVIFDDKPHQNFSDVPSLPEFISPIIQSHFSYRNQDSHSMFDGIYSPSINMVGSLPILPFAHPSPFRDSQVQYPYESFRHAQPEDRFINQTDLVDHLYYPQKKEIRDKLLNWTPQLYPQFGDTLAVKYTEKVMYGVDQKIVQFGADQYFRRESNPPYPTQNLT